MEDFVGLFLAARMAMFVMTFLCLESDGLRLAVLRFAIDLRCHCALSRWTMLMKHALVFD